MIPGFGFVFTLHFGLSQAPRTPDDGWFSNDKARHFFTSAFFESFTYSALRSARVSKEGALVGASIVTAGLGVGKELYDRKFGGDPSLKDLAADAAGMGAAVVLLHQTSR